LKKLDDLDFYLVTYSSISRNGTYSDVKNAIDAGCKIIQYREKNKSTREMVKEAKKLKQICESKAIFLVNDRIDVALAVDADGVHIGQSGISVDDARRILGKEKIIGLTVHNVEEAIQAEKMDVDYVGLAPIYNTDTKEDSGIPCGPETIAEVRKNINLPIVAVGGVNKNNVKEVIFNGADGAVAVSAVLDSDDVYSNVDYFIRKIKEAKLNDDSA
jgi:thiamine-phosphate pyrophosphorylase